VSTASISQKQFTAGAIVWIGEFLSPFAKRITVRKWQIWR